MFRLSGAASSSGGLVSRRGGGSVISDYQSTTQPSVRMIELRQVLYPRVYRNIEEPGIVAQEVDVGTDGQQALRGKPPASSILRASASGSQASAGSRLSSKSKPKAAI